MKTLTTAFIILFFIFSLASCGTTGAADDTGDGGGGGGGDVSAEVSTVESEIHTLINAERAAEGLSALTRNTSLDSVARAHSQDMLDNDFFSHTNLDGEDPAARATAAGISYSVFAENLAWTYGLSASTLASETVEGWMDSPDHRANILEEDGYSFTQTGIGAAMSSDGSEVYYTQVFMTP